MKTSKQVGMKPTEQDRNDTDTIPTSCAKLTDLLHMEVLDNDRHGSYLKAFD